MSTSKNPAGGETDKTNKISLAFSKKAFIFLFGAFAPLF
jgi:hypothetical protein